MYFAFTANLLVASIKFNLVKLMSENKKIGQTMQLQAKSSSASYCCNCCSGNLIWHNKL